MPTDFWRWSDTPASKYEEDSTIFARQVLARSGLAGTGLAEPPVPAAPPPPSVGTGAGASPTPPPAPVPFAGVGSQPSPTPAPAPLPLPQTPTPPPGVLQPLAPPSAPDASLTSVETPPPPAPTPRQLMPDASVTGGQPDATGGGDIEAYVRQRAAAHSIDPDVAVAVANSEGGLHDWTRQSDYVYQGKREESYGPFQLFMNGGLGNTFMQETGLDPRLAENGPAAVDWALQYASQHGWSAWHGAQRIGLDAMAGIGQAAQGAVGGLSDIGHTIGGAVTGAADTAVDYGRQAARTAGGLVGGAADTAGGAIGIGSRFLGVPYVFGAASGDTTAFDCSSFVQTVYNQLGLSLPRVAYDQWRATADGAVDLKSARPGDLIFFKNTYAAGNPENISHVAIYAGHGEFLGAQGADVNVGSLSNPYWSSRLAGVHHVGDAASSGAATTTLGLVADSPNPVVPATRRVTGETAGPAERSYSEQWTDRILGGIGGAASTLAGGLTSGLAAPVAGATAALAQGGPSGLASSAGRSLASAGLGALDALDRPSRAVRTATEARMFEGASIPQALEAGRQGFMGERPTVQFEDLILRANPAFGAKVPDPVVRSVLAGAPGGPLLAEAIVGAGGITYAQALGAATGAASDPLNALEFLGPAARGVRLARAPLGRALGLLGRVAEVAPPPAVAAEAVPAARAAEGVAPAVRGAVESAAVPPAVGAEGRGATQGFALPQPPAVGAPPAAEAAAPARWITQPEVVPTELEARLAFLQQRMPDSNEVRMAAERIGQPDLQQNVRDLLDYAATRFARQQPQRLSPALTSFEDYQQRFIREASKASPRRNAQFQQEVEQQGADLLARSDAPSEVGPWGDRTYRVPGKGVVSVSAPIADIPPHITMLYVDPAARGGAVTARLLRMAERDVGPLAIDAGGVSPQMQALLTGRRGELPRRLFRDVGGDNPLQIEYADELYRQAQAELPRGGATPRPSGSTTLQARGGGAIIGGIAGYAAPADTPEERWQHALMGAAGGGALEFGLGRIAARGLARPAVAARYGVPSLDRMAEAFANQRPSGFLQRMRAGLPDAPAWLRKQFVTDANYADTLTAQARQAAGQTNERLTPAAIDAEARYAAWQGRHVAGETFTRQGLEPAFRLLATPADREAFSIMRELQRVIETAQIRIARGHGGAAQMKFPFGLTSLTEARSALATLERQVGPQRWTALRQADRVVQDHLNAILDLKVKAGIIDPALATLLKTEHPHYSPQVLADAEQAFGSGGGRGSALDNLSNGLRRLSALGHTDETLDPLVATIATSLREYDRVMRNDVALSIVDANRALYPNDTKLVSQWVPNQAIPLDPAQVQAVGKGPFKALTPREHAITPKGIWVSRNGKSQLWSVPKEGLDFAHGMDRAPVIYDGWQRVSKVLNDFQRGVFTERNPIFPLLNGAADAGVAGMSGVGPRALGSGYRHAIAHEFGGNDPLTREFLLGGGGMGGYSGGGAQGARKLLSSLEAAGQSKGALQRLVNGALDTATFKVVGKYGRPIENAPRLAAYEKELGYQAAHGVSNPARAVMAGRRVTVDFSRAGSWVRHANAVTLFLNAGLQGTYRFAGLLTNPTTRVAARRFLYGVAAATTAAYAMNRQYVKSDGTLYLDDIPDYVKDTSQVLLIPGTETVDADGHESMKFVAIPTRILGVVSNPIQHGLRALDANHPEALTQGLTELFGPSFAAERPRPVPQSLGQELGGTLSSVARVASPIQGEPGAGAFVSSIIPSTVGTLAEAEQNYDWYRGFPIVPPRLENLPPEFQYDPQRTTPVAQALSAGARGLPLGLADVPFVRQFQSPMKTDFILQGIGGGPAALYGGLVDVGLGEPAKGAEQVRQATIGRIVRDRSGQANRDVTGAFLADAQQREVASVEELRNSALWASATPEEQQSLVAGLHARAQSAALRELPPDQIPDFLKDRVAGTPSEPGEPPKYVARRLPADVRSYYSGRYGLMAEDMSRASDYIQLWKRNRRLMAPPSPWQRRLALLANRTNPAWERWNARQGRQGRDVRQSTLDYAVAQAAS